MQSLLDDPTFYNLLLSNNESMIKDDNTEIQPKQDTVEDFSFLKKLEFPTMNGNFQPSIATESSYQSSVFSNNPNNNNNNNNNNRRVNEVINEAPFNDFYSKEIDLQINSEKIIPSDQSTTASNSNFQLTPIANAIDEFQSQFPSNLSGEHPPKNFHKFYTSNPSSSSNPQVSIPSTISSNNNTIQSNLIPPSINKIPSKIQKPSLPSSSTIHICPFCQRQFKNKPYLARHLKKHDTVKEFKCPFFNENEAKCHHLNGEFSRKDTYKAHLKSIHFIYPVGVFKSDRNLSIGRCASCYKQFNNNNEWFLNHIENNECPSLVKNLNSDLDIKTEDPII